MSAYKQEVELIFRKEAFAFACRTVFKNFEEVQQDEIFELMVKLTDKGGEVSQAELDKLGLADVEHAKEQFKILSTITLNVYTCLILGASRIIEYSLNSDISLAELEEVVDEL